MKLNLLVDICEPLTRGPGRRASNLMLGLDRIGVEYEICGEDYEWSVGLQCNKVFNCWEKMPSYALIGPNVMHNAGDHTGIAAKFKNYLVQSDWVADYWKWQFPKESEDFNFFVYPASVDLKNGFSDIAYFRKPVTQCLFYSKYQSDQNREIASYIFKARGHSFTHIEYGHYTLDQLKEACRTSHYCIYNSCCEKSSNALIEIMACGIPVYVIDSKRWIGDDKFDRCTSAPHFNNACGVIGDFYGKDFDIFYQRVQHGEYEPHSFVLMNHTVEKVAADLVEVVKKCHG